MKYVYNDANVLSVEIISVGFEYNECIWHFRKCIFPCGVQFYMGWQSK